MKTSIILGISLILITLLSGCVSRTISSGSINSGTKSAYGAKNSNERVIEKKRVWVWQDEFRNP